MKVKELATSAGVNPDTVRFYTREGLLKPSRNPDNNYQHYDAEDLRRLRFARSRFVRFWIRQMTITRPALWFGMYSSNGWQRWSERLTSYSNCISG